MTATPSPQPVTAWTIIDIGNNLNLHRMHDQKSHAEFFARGFDGMYPDRAPHRVIEITITPKEKG